MLNSIVIYIGDVRREEAEQANLEFQYAILQSLLIDGIASNHYSNQANDIERQKVTPDAGYAQTNSNADQDNS